MIFKATAILIAVAVAPIQPQEFKTAKKNAEKKGKTLVVVIGAEWCPACVTMKNSTIQEAAKSGALKDAEYTYVDYDKNPELAKKLMRGSSIPQLMKFDYKEQKWIVHRYQGSYADSFQVSGFISKK